MEKRRRTIRLLALAVGLSAAGAALACEPPLQGTRLESGRYALVFQALPEVGKFFRIDVAACSKAGGAPPEALKIDATMPEHRHGMNYAPTVKALAPGRWRAEGLMFHMLVSFLAASSGA